MTVDPDALQRRLDAMVASGDMPGAQVSVLSGGAVVSAASGVLNLRTRQPVTTESLFQIGSITKIWTASALLQMVDAGTLDLDRPVRTYLPELRLSDDLTTAEVTTRHLLTHTSGIEGDVFTDTGQNPDYLQRYVAALRGQPLLHALGETWSYCNAGFGIAGRLLEVLDGKPFERALRDRLPGPLRIERFAWNADEAILWGAAVGHVRTPTDPQVRVTPQFSLPRSAAPAGLIITTTADLVRFAGVHLANGVTDDGTAILSAQSVKAMQVDQCACPSAYADAWGIGWMLHDWPGARVVGHGGATIGQSTELLLVPDHGVAVALAVNGPRGQADHALLGELLAQLAGVEVPPLPAPPSTPPEIDATRYVGVYGRLGTESTVAQAADGTLTLTTRLSGPLAEISGYAEGPPLPLVPTSRDGDFVVPDVRFTDVWTEARFYAGSPGQAPRFLHLAGRANRRLAGDGSGNVGAPVARR